MMNVIDLNSAIAEAPREKYMNSAHTLYAQTKAYARDFPWKSWWCILSTAFLLLCAMVGTLPVFPLYLRIASSFLAGLLSLRLFVIYHDQQHRAILPRSRLAEFFMRLFGIWALSPSSIWRSSHDHHHAHNSKLLGSHIGSYPIMTKEQYQKSPAGIRFKYLFMRHPLTILFGYFFVFHFGMVVIPFLQCPAQTLRLPAGIAAAPGVGGDRWCACLAGLPGCSPSRFRFLSPPPWAAISFTRNTISPAFPSTTRPAGPLKRPRSNLQFPEDQSGDGVVYRQHRLSPHPPSQPPHPVLPAARNLPGHPRIAEGQDHFAQSDSNLPLPAPESVGRGVRSAWSASVDSNWCPGIVFGTRCDPTPSGLSSFQPIHPAWPGFIQQHRGEGSDFIGAGEKPEEQVEFGWWDVLVGRGS